MSKKKDIDQQKEIFRGRGHTGPQDFDRRDFLKLGGAAAVFAALGCAQRPVEKIVPYNQRPEGEVPGKPMYYATTCRDGTESYGVIAKVLDGRPIKLDGNDNHPLNRGAMSARAEASLLDLYDPDRQRFPAKKSGDTWTELSFKQADREIVTKLQSLVGKGEAVLFSGPWNGPAREALVADVLYNFPEARHFKFNSLTDYSFAAARKSIYGNEKPVNYRFDKSELTVLFGADPFANGRNRVRMMADFSGTRSPENGRMSRMIAFSPAVGETDSMADERYYVKPSRLADIAAAMVHQLVLIDNRGVDLVPSDARLFYNDYRPGAIESELHLPAGIIKELCDELWRAQGKSLLISENVSNQNLVGSFNLHLSVNLLNAILGNEDRTVESTSVPESHKMNNVSELSQLITRMKAGKIAAIFFMDANPAYYLPAECGFVDALAHVPLRVSFSCKADETAQFCEYILPGLHFAENWGDSEPHMGIYSLEQPLIYPIWNNRSAEDSILSLGAIMGVSKFKSQDTVVSWVDYLKNYWKDNIFPSSGVAANFDSFWTKLLQTGYYDNRKNISGVSGVSAPNISYAADLKNKTILKTDLEAGGLELWLTAGSLHSDGTAMNNAWLLETPDPVTRVTWDNFVCLNPANAGNFEKGEIVSAACGDRNIEIPLNIQPTVAPGVAAIQLGWGRQSVGNVGNGIGSNGFKLAAAGNGWLCFSGMEVKLSSTGNKTKLASVQGYDSDLDRGIVISTTLEQFAKNPTAGHHEHEIPDELEIEKYRKGRDTKIPTMWGKKAQLPGPQMGDGG